MNNKVQTEELIAAAAESGGAPDAAPTRLKSRIYSALMLAEAAEGKLRDLSETVSAGWNLCVFEQIVQIAPVGSTAKAFNYCRVCHGRLMGENIENPPLYWSCCPYAEFKNG